MEVSALLRITSVYWFSMIAGNLRELVVLANNPTSGEVVLYPLKTEQNIYIVQIPFKNRRSSSPSGLLSKIRNLKMPSKNKVNQVNLSKTPTLVVMATSRYLVDSLEKIHYFLGCFRLYL